MRTVEDLREALVSLEDGAPAVGDLLLALSGGTQRVERRPRRWLLPATAAGLTIAVLLGVAALAAWGSGPRRATGAAHTTVGAAPSGPGGLLPFRLTSSLPEASLVYVHSDAAGGASYGTAVVAEYGMEVTIDVRSVGGESTRSPAARHTDVNGVRGWIDTGCRTRVAPTSTAPLATSATDSTPPEFDPGCAVTYDKGPWHVAIYVAGPGGGSRTITPEQFLRIGNRMQLAATPGDTSTWFAANGLLPS